MLLWRAAGHCADVICPEVRMGFAVEDEADDARPVTTATAARVDVPVSGPVTVDEVFGDDEPQDADLFDPPSDTMMRGMHAGFSNLGVQREGRLRVLSQVLGHEVTTSKQLSHGDVGLVLNVLSDVRQAHPHDGPDARAELEKVATELAKRDSEAGR
jgi:hypothetical protein